jgi:hypothetical protein
VPCAVATVALVVRLVHWWFFRRNPLSDEPVLDARFYESWAARIAGRRVRAGIRALARAAARQQLARGARRGRRQ